ncbi:MAG: hypothetical protein M0Q21_10205 [Ignavibacteriaceae bacterium]|nr:hypothetical protein [Ignavibacteriaceae bacterium]
MEQNTNEYGKIFSLSEAVHLFGEVKISFPVNSKELLTHCSKTESVIMFGVENATLFIAGKGRNILQPAGVTLSPEFAMRVFQILKVEELLKLGNSEITEIELRDEVLDLKNGEFILELGMPCPPYCA